MVHDVFVRFAQSADRIKTDRQSQGLPGYERHQRVRNCRRDASRHGETGLDGADHLPSSQRGPQQWAILGEQLTLLSRALQELPYEQREVIGLRMEMDMTFRQIATLQGVSSDTVKGRYRYGMEKLRSLLNGEVENETRRGHETVVQKG